MFFRLILRRVALPQINPELEVIGRKKADDRGLSGRRECRIEVKEAERDLPKLGARIHHERSVEEAHQVSGLLRKVPRNAKGDLQVGWKGLQRAINLVGDFVRVLATKQVVDGGVAISGGD